jgi:hypothetical protein
MVAASPDGTPRRHKDATVRDRHRRDVLKPLRRSNGSPDLAFGLPKRSLTAARVDISVRVRQRIEGTVAIPRNRSLGRNRPCLEKERSPVVTEEDAPVLADPVPARRVALRGPFDFGAQVAAIGESFSLWFGWQDPRPVRLPKKHQPWAEGPSRVRTRRLARLSLA